MSGNRIDTLPDGRVVLTLAQPDGTSVTLPPATGMLPEEEAVVALLNAHVELRPAKLPASARCLSVDAAEGTATWSCGHVTSIIPATPAT